MSRTLHSLNAARVIFELCIVHYHTGLLYPSSNNDRGILSNDVIGIGFMSFFFVLSGFVATFTHMECTEEENAEWRREYMKHRLTKVYPVYFLWYLMDLPGTIVVGLRGCPYFWLNILLQPFLISPWLGFGAAGMSNSAGWYLTTLFWMWLIFPYLPTRMMFEQRPWTIIIAFYCLSIVMWMFLVPFDPIYTREVPIFRIWEFLMGCGVAYTIKNRIHFLIPWTCVILFLAYSIVTMKVPQLWYIPTYNVTETPEAVCSLWKPSRRKMSPDMILSFSSVIWAVLIHWLAASEYTLDETTGVLQHDIFKTLSSCSLELYLSHRPLQQFLETIGLKFIFSFDLMLVFCSIFAYGLAVYVRPRLNTAYEHVFLHIGQCLYPTKAIPVDWT
jgi:hypothetical protein